MSISVLVWSFRLQELPTDFWVQLIVTAALTGTAVFLGAYLAQHQADKRRRRSVLIEKAVIPLSERLKLIRNSFYIDILPDISVREDGGRKPEPFQRYVGQSNPPVVFLEPVDSTERALLAEAKQEWDSLGTWGDIQDLASRVYGGIYQIQTRLRMLLDRLGNPATILAEPGYPAAVSLEVSNRFFSMEVANRFMEDRADVMDLNVKTESPDLAVIRCGPVKVAHCPPDKANAVLAQLKRAIDEAGVIDAVTGVYDDAELIIVLAEELFKETVAIMAISPRRRNRKR